MSASTSVFSSSESAVLEPHSEAIAVIYEQIWNDSHRNACTDWIRQNGYKRVCLQFPDDYLPHSIAISDSLKASFPTSDFKVFILADNTYGSCCVDEITAAHVEADSIVHFGNACRSKVSRLPVLYLYPQMPIQLVNLLHQLSSIKSKCENQNVCVYLDIGYQHLLKQQNEVDSVMLNAKLSEILGTKTLHIDVYPPPEDGKIDFELRETCICIFIGSDNSRFANLSLTTKAARWFVYDASNNIITEKNPLTANYIRRRYYFIEKCKDSKTLGLVVATLTANGYLDIISRLQEMSKSRGIKTQIISVGRINPAKLANFLEIDCFVLIGCPFNISYTSKDYYKPIVSVFEAEIALNPAWYMKYPEAYVTDFRQLLPMGRSFIAFEPDKNIAQDVSLVSGQLRGGHDATTNGKTQDEGSTTVATQAKMTLMTTNTGLAFEDRTWQGLEPALGQTEPAKLQKGLSGIPIKYTHD